MCIYPGQVQYMPVLRPDTTGDIMPVALREATLRCGLYLGGSRRVILTKPMQKP